MTGRNDSAPTEASVAGEAVGARMPRRGERSTIRADLKDLYEHPGPYLSIYLDIEPGTARATAASRILKDLKSLETQPGPVSSVLEFIDSAPEDDAMLCVLMASDGTTLHATMTDPPRHDVVRVDELPYVGPLFEAFQSQVHHVVAVLGDEGTDLVLFPGQGEPVIESTSLRESSAVSDWLLAIIDRVDTDLMILVGTEAPTHELYDRLLGQLGPDRSTAVATWTRADGAEKREEGITGDVVRAVANHVATETVETLRLWRFHLAHGAATDGLVDTFSVLKKGRAGLLIVHDDPEDTRYAWFGKAPNELSIDLEHRDSPMQAQLSGRARLTDVLIRSAFLQGAAVRMIPSTGDTGPADDIGSVLADRQAPAAWRRSTTGI